MNAPAETIRARLAQVRERIARAAAAAGRDPAAVRLVVVSKSQPLETVRAAVAAGARILGENYPEEAAGKMAALGTDGPAEWHMIGHVQSRKAALVAGRFGLFHALDSLKLAAKLDRLCLQAGTLQDVLLEFNVGLEASKYGWPAADAAALDGLLPELESVLACAGLRVRGLMAMPPLGTAPETARPYFVRLRRLQDALRRRFPQADWSQLSMGTSSDFEIAVQEGATLVRVGQAILGSRPRI